MKKQLLSLTAVLFLGGVCSVWAHSSGISVDPSYIKFSDVELKGTVRLEKKAGYLLKIGNNGETDAVYEISLHSCKEAGIKPNGGYEEFPNIKWFVFRSTEVIAPAHSDGYLRYLKITGPAGGSYANKKWQVVIKVARKTKDTINMEALIPLWLETKAEKKVKKKAGDRK